MMNKRGVLFKKKEEPLVKVSEGSKIKQIKASEASPELYRVKSMWPFDFFPDELIIEEKRVIIKRNILPFFNYTVTSPIDNIELFEVTHSIFFSSVLMRINAVNLVEETFSWLKHDDAQKIKEIVDGLRMSKQKIIEVEDVSAKGMKEKLLSIGHFV